MKALQLATALALLLHLLPVNARYDVTLRVPAPVREDLPLQPAAPQAPDPRFVKTIGLPFSFGASPALADGPTLEITKAGTPEFPNAVDQGGQIVYAITITNTSVVSPAYDVVVDDTTPANTTCTDVGHPQYWFDNNCSPGGDPSWILPTSLITTTPPLTPGVSATLVYTVTVDQPLPDQTVIVNPAGSYQVRTEDNAPFLGTRTVTTVVNAPHWTITKSAEPDPVQPGQPLTYTINVTNTGHLTTSGTYTVTDSIPEFTNFVAATEPFSLVGQTVTWVFSTALGIDQSQTLTMVVTPTVPLTDGLIITNDAYAVTGGNVFSDGIGSPVTVTVDAPADLTIVKTADPEPVQAGGLLTYTLTVTNEATALGPALDVVITDTLPDKTIFQSMGIAPPHTGTTTTPVTGSQVITWSLFQPIPPGDAARLTATVRVTSPEVAGTIITNTYSLTASNIPAVIAGTPTTSTISSTNVITLSKSVFPEVVPAGAVVTYTIVATNTGNGIAAVSLTDTLHPAITSPTVFTGSFVLPGRDLDDVPGEITLVFTATAPVTAGVYANPTVTAVYDDQQTVITDTAPFTVAEPVLNISKADDPDPVGIGQLLRYTITYSNSGGLQADNVVLTDTLDPNVTFVTSTLGPPDNVDGTSLSWNVAPLPGASGEVTEVITVQVPLTLDDLAVLSNTASIISDRATLTDTGVVTTLVHAPVLNIVKTASPTPTVQAGGTLTYNLLYTNSGHLTATNLIITDTLDDNVSLLSADPPETSQVGQVLTWTGLPDLPPLGGSGVITVVVTVTSPLSDGTVLQNTAAITTAELKGDSVDPPVTTTVTAEPVWDIAKTASAAQIEAGERLTYTITYTNAGNEIATDVTITDTLDSNVTLVSVAPPTSTQVGPDLVWTFPSVSPLDGSQVITVVVDVNSPLPNGTVLTNSVVITSSRGVSDTAVLTTTVTSAPLLDIVKTDSPDPVNAGETLVYTLTYSNTGNADATNVLITDTLDGNTTFASADPAPNPATCPVCEWGPLTVPAGSLQTIVVTTTVNAPLADRTVLTNAVTMTEPSTNTVYTDVETTTVRATDVSISKSVAPSPALAGDPIVYTITYSNAAGAPPALDVIISDTLPISVSAVGVVSSTTDAVFSANVGRTFVWTDSVVPGTGVARTIIITSTVITSPWPSTLLDMTNLVTITTAIPEVSQDQANNTGSTTSQGGPNLPFTITLLAVPDTTPVIGPVAITATVRDAYGNPVLNGTAVDFSTNLGNLSPASTTTSNGQATTSLTSTLVGTATVLATSNGVTRTTVVTFTSGPLDHFDIATIPNQVAGVPFSITITARDAANNVVTSFAGPVNLSDATGTLLPASSGPFVNGVWTGPVSVTKATELGPPPVDAITATFGTTTTQRSNDFEVFPGPPAQATLVTAAPQHCGGAAQQSARVRDAFGNDVLAGVPVTFTTTAGQIQSPVSTNNFGIATAVLTAPNGPPLNTTVAVDVNGDLTPEDSAVVTFGTPGRPTNMSLSAAPNTIPIFGSSTLTAQFEDCVGTPIANANVSLSIVSGPAGTTLNPDSGTTNAGGTFTSTFRADVFGGPATVRVQDDATGLTATTVITVDGAPDLNVVKLVEPASVTVTAGTRLTYTVILSNNGNAGASGVQITDAVPTGATYVPGSASAVRDEPGVPPANLPVTGPQPLVVNVGTLTPTGIVTFTFQVTATFGTTISNVATVSSDQLPDRNSNQVDTGLEGGLFLIHLPLILKNFPAATPADLVVDQVKVTPAGPSTSQNVVIEVTIRNASTVDIPAGTPFWVDAYITTAVVTPSVNTRWNDVPGAHGVAWKVGGLAAGQSLTLSNLAPNLHPIDPNACDNFSDFTPPSVGPCSWPGNSNRFSQAGTYFVVALVDSFAEDSTLSDGNVTETNEGNNLSSVVTVVVTASAPTVAPAEEPAPPAWGEAQPGQPRPALPD